MTCQLTLFLADLRRRGQPGNADPPPPTNNFQTTPNKLDELLSARLSEPLTQPFGDSGPLSPGDPDSEQKFARGGHGIFGEPKVRIFGIFYTHFLLQ